MKNLKNLLFLSASIILVGIACSKSGDNSQTSGNWVKGNEFPGFNRSGAMGFVIGNIGYITCGFNAGTDTSLSDTWSYDPQSGYQGTWSNYQQIAQFPGHSRHSGVAFSVGNYGYVGTGVDDNNTVYQDNYQYDPSTNTWTAKAALPNSGAAGTNARFDAVAFSIGNYGYVGTGNTNANLLKDFWKYDPSADSWTSIGFPGSKREGAVAFTDPLDTAGYVVTGANNGSVGAVNDFWRYSPTSGWYQLRNITNTSSDNYDDDYTDIIRQNAVAFVMKDNGVWKAFLATGANGSLVDKTWEYDFASDLWVRKTPFSEGGIRNARKQAIAWSFISLSRAFVLTGSTGSTTLDDVAEFFPAIAENTTD